MAYEAALSIVNQLHSQMATLARSGVTALADKRVSSWEMMQIIMQGTQFGSYLITMLQGVDAQTRKDILNVLEHGVVVIPPDNAVSGISSFQGPESES